MSKAPANPMRRPLQVGAAKVDITPWAGVQLAGDVGGKRGASYVLDPLYARALVLDDGVQKLCLLSCDLTITCKKPADQVRQAAATLLGISPQAVMVHVTQTHTAPGLGSFMLDDDFPNLPADAQYLRGNDESYDRFAVEKMIAAVRQAASSLQEAQLVAGRGLDGRWAHNRRGVRRDGKVFMPGPQAPAGGWPEMSHLEGPCDPEIVVAGFRTANMAFPALLLHYTCHPVNVYPRTVVSSDWCGVWAGVLENVLGAAAMPLVINGCCGNINPWHPYDPAFKPDHQAMGQALGHVGLQVLEKAAPGQAAPLGFARQVVDLPLAAIDPQALAQARQTLAAQPGVKWTDGNSSRADWTWCQAAHLVSKDLQRQRDKVLPYEVQVFRIGELAIVGLPGEPFVEGQLQIKLASPAKHTIVAHCINQYVGYLPVADGFARGGHEVNYSKIEPDALGQVVDTAVALLGKLYA